jgi:Nucleotidyltransferase domain/Domain of unknown function (DUF4111)
VDRYVRWADRMLPGRVVGAYVVGSTALGAYREGRSDLDVVMVLDRPVPLRRLRALHAVSWPGAAARAWARGQVWIPGNVNAVYVEAGDLARPVTTIVPVASHTGLLFVVGKGFDVNPVMWKVLAERGIAVRGDEPGALGLDPEPGVLKDWNLGNLDSYWGSWAADLRAGRGQWWRTSGWTVAWGALGAPRLHCTIATGEVVSKEAAGEYALATFGDEWRSVVEEGLAYCRGEPSPRHFRDRGQRTGATAAFVQEVVRSAHGL